MRSSNYTRTNHLMALFAERYTSLGKFRLGWGITPQPGGKPALKGLRAASGESSSESQSFHELLILAGNIDQIRLSG